MEYDFLMQYKENILWKWWLGYQRGSLENFVLFERDYRQNSKDIEILVKLKSIHVINFILVL